MNLKKILIHSIKKYKEMFFIGISFVCIFIPHLTHAAVLSPGNINTCGELAAPGTYTLTADINVGSTVDCFLVTSDGVDINPGPYEVTGKITINNNTWTDNDTEWAGERTYEFNNSSSNTGIVSSTTFNDTSYNSGTVSGDALFNDSSYNKIMWTEQTSAGSRTWQSITSSADGTKLAAVVYDGRIYRSVNGGVDWTEVTSTSPANMTTNRYWRSITSSADGMKLAAVAYGGRIYTSVNGGVDWTEVTSTSPANMATNRNWRSITSSSDGTKLAAVVYNGRIYTSSNSGVDWTEVISTSSADMTVNRTWQSITSSADGTKLAAVVINGYIYLH
jgi:hypothetical protein